MTICHTPFLLTYLDSYYMKLKLWRCQLWYTVVAVEQCKNAAVTSPRWSTCTPAQTIGHFWYPLAHSVHFGIHLSPIKLQNCDDTLVHSSFCWAIWKCSCHINTEVVNVCTGSNDSPSFTTLSLLRYSSSLYTRLRNCDDISFGSQWFIRSNVKTQLLHRHWSGDLCTCSNDWLLPIHFATLGLLWHIHLVLMWSQKIVRISALVHSGFCGAMQKHSCPIKVVNMCTCLKDWLPPIPFATIRMLRHIYLVFIWSYQIVTLSVLVHGSFCGALWKCSSHITIEVVNAFEYGGTGRNENNPITEKLDALMKSLEWSNSKLLPPTSRCQQMPSNHGNRVGPPALLIKNCKGHS